jgi:hypothetical protein
MAKRERNRRRYRIVLSDGVNITEVSRQDFESHLAAHRIEPFKHDERKAATKEGWLSYIDFKTGLLMFAARETKVGVALPSNFKLILSKLIFNPPFNEWANMQNAQVYEKAVA